MVVLPVHNAIMNSITYVLYSEDSDYCVLIDCGEWETLQPVLKQINRKVDAVLLTHGHSDHIYGILGLLKSQPNVSVYTNDIGHIEIQDSRMNLSFYHGNPFTIKGYHPMIIEDKQLLHFEGIADIEIIATPGHDTSCLTYKVNKHLFSGDAYIPGLKTFTKFPRGNKEQALKSVEMLSYMEQQGYFIHCGHHSY